MPTTPLNPAGNPVRVGSMTIRTPGLTGAAESKRPAGPGMRAPGFGTEALEEVMAAQSLRTIETLEISRARPAPVGGGATRSASFGRPGIELQVAAPGENFRQVVLAVDEAGVMTWHYPEPAQGPLDVTRGPGAQTFYIPSRVQPAPGAGATRGLAGMLGKKVLQLVVFPVVDPIIGKVGDFFAARWEKKNRPYRLRMFGPADYRDPAPAPLTDADWATLQGGRALLFVHGTFSRAHSAFGGLPPEVLTELHSRYGGRVFAFDHFTVSEDPRQNIEWFGANLPPAARLEVDIICHSRGGLVSRTLAETPALIPAGKSVDVKRVVLAASPNAGTVLTDTKYLGHLVDGYTNLLNFFPDNGVTDVLEVIVAVVKQLATAAMDGLEGLQSMLPGGPFLAALNSGAPTGTQYSALASNYEPVEAGLKAYAEDVFWDNIFKAPNDLVVPTDGVWDVNGDPNFPIGTRHVFAEGDGVAHSGYFRNAVGQQKILEWLSF